MQAEQDGRDGKGEQQVMAGVVEACLQRGRLELSLPGRLLMARLWPEHGTSGSGQQCLLALAGDAALLLALGMPVQVRLRVGILVCIGVLVCIGILVGDILAGWADSHVNCSCKRMLSKQQPGNFEEASSGYKTSTAEVYCSLKVARSRYTKKQFDTTATSNAAV